MIPVVFSADHNFVMPTGVALTSLLSRNYPGGYHVYILAGDDVTDSDRQKLSQTVATLSPCSRISFVDMSGFFSSGYEVRGISKACYYRLMIPWLIPEEDKIIYLDGDIIVKSTLEDLYAVDVDGKYVAGGEPNSARGWSGMKKYFDKLGIDYREYINSGVLVINSALQRADGLDKTYRELANNRYLYQDQDIINIVCKGRIAHFSNRFNLFPSYVGTDASLTDNCIIHYAGDKPWKTFTYAWMEWWDAYKVSVFFDYAYYRQISSGILSLSAHLKNLRKKFRQKSDQFLARLKY